MPKSMPDAARRLVVARLMLDLFRGTSAIIGRDEFGPHATDILLMAAVFVGQAEGKPMNAGKLAIYAGIPRPTAVRRLAALGADGMVSRGPGATFTLLPARFATPAARASFAAQRQAVRLSAIALSKLDTESIASPQSKNVTE